MTCQPIVLTGMHFEKCRALFCPCRTARQPCSRCQPCCSAARPSARWCCENVHARSSCRQCCVTSYEPVWPLSRWRFWHCPNDGTIGLQPSPPLQQPDQHGWSGCWWGAGVATIGWQRTQLRQRARCQPERCWERPLQPRVAAAISASRSWRWRCSQPPCACSTAWGPANTGACVRAYLAPASRHLHSADLVVLVGQRPWCIGVYPFVARILVKCLAMHVALLDRLQDMEEYVKSALQR
jgi:hypothetical protein